MFSYNDLHVAWQMIRSKQSAGGVDKRSVKDFAKNETENLKRIERKLKEQTYLPEAYLQIKIDKNKTEKRILGLATINDKIVQTAIKNLIESRLETGFLNSSYAYREGRGARKAVNKVRHYIQTEKNYWLAKCDIDNFFDNINHKRLKKQLKPYISDKYLLELIFAFIKMGYVTGENHWIERQKAKKITAAEQAVKQRRKIYEQKAAAMSHLHIDGYGISLGITKHHISIKEYGKKTKKFPAYNLKQITIASKATSVSTKLIKYCADHNIPVDFVNKHGKAYAKIYHYQSTHDRLWLKQMQHTTGKTAFDMARLLTMSKINNQIKLIKYFSKYARQTEQDIAQQLPTSLDTLNQIYKKIKQMSFKTGFRQILMGFEGSASAQYWQWFKLMVDEETDFTTRKNQGATDLVNSLLNYGYAILYRQVWNSVIRYGLHPELSFLHSYQKGKGTLIFDLIEPFRQPVVDRAVLSLINRKTRLKIEQGKLDDKTKQKLITAVYKNLTRYDKYLGERLQMIDIIHKQTQQLKLYITGQNKKFKPYKTTKW